MICDSCSADVTPHTCYYLTTRQVVLSREYWEIIIRKILTPALELMGSPDLAELAVKAQATRAAEDRTAWVICEQCSQLFTFDHVLAREHAANGVQPPGCGPVDAREVEAVALKAWKAVHETWPPNSQQLQGFPQRERGTLPTPRLEQNAGWFKRLRTRLRGGRRATPAGATEVRQEDDNHPLEGLPCVFCGVGISTADPVWAGITAEALTKLIGRVPVERPSAVNPQGEHVWLSHQACMEDAGRAALRHKDST